MYVCMYMMYAKLKWNETAGNKVEWNVVLVCMCVSVYMMYTKPKLHIYICMCHDTTITNTYKNA